MATAAQIEANRRNSLKSTGPRTDDGKSRSRFNALDHGCRANILVLPTEDFGEYEKEANAWKLSWKPRNPTEELLVDRIVNLSWQAKRIDRAQTARLSARIHRGERRCRRSGTRDRDRAGTAIVPGRVRAGCAFACAQHGRVERGPRYAPRFGLFEYRKSPPTSCPLPSDDSHRLSVDAGPVGRPTRLAGTGRTLARTDKLKAIRLLGRHPIDALDSIDVAEYISPVTCSSIGKATRLRRY